MQTKVKTEEELAAMRQGGSVLAATLRMLKAETKPGISTDSLDKLADTMIRDHGMKPSFLGYQGFPASLCVSVNDELVHGIPSNRIIESGDIVGLDLGVTNEGMITDSAITVPVGQISPQAKSLLNATEQALMKAIDVVSDGMRVGDIGYVVSTHIKQAGFCVVETLCGHGVGRQVHEEPSIFNIGNRGTGQVLKAGMTIAIEPCIAVSTTEIVLGADGWTCLSDDGSLTAQFEHTVLITKTGSEILTE